MHFIATSLFLQIAVSAASVTDPTIQLVLVQLKEVFERLRALEERLTGREQFAVGVFIILSPIGFLSYFEIKRVITRKLTDNVMGKVGAKIDAAQKALEESKQKYAAEISKVSKTNEAAEAAIGRLTAFSADQLTQGSHIIQTGSDPVTFTDTNYRNFEVIFPTPFPVVPQVFVGEANAGAWLIVKVDKKDATKFTWAASNLLGKATYSTVIQWLAIAPNPRAKRDDPQKQA